MSQLGVWGVTYWGEIDLRGGARGKVLRVDVDDLDLWVGGVNPATWKRIVGHDARVG